MSRSPKTKKKPAQQKKARPSRTPVEVIDLKARDTLTLVGEALGALHGLDSTAQAKVDAATTACRATRS